ncbi:Oidioi.mRNA.OKI2018_I69.chr2.g8100.t1.cds [Oikopleura dioica]|uniref:Oidioi.mRNA.OKI2018_I69.chr2.g8100.t1.cds n=1 Tax=Oikopleura dioica TaxID=34765 RepID=A0ABN7TBL8_OIKDI|nr:Oidioi.mRNA.OKI2018_I69.chr2.g8100.t1.cds [Oikopleura dioica]
MSSGDASKTAEPPEDNKEDERDETPGQFTSEDEAWRSYLENPSMGLSIAANDEDTAGALATLYEYYKVPPDKRTKLGPASNLNKNNSSPTKSVKLHASSSSTRSITLVKTEPSTLSQSIPVKNEPDEDSNTSVGKIPGVISGQAITIENFNSNTFISRRSPDSTYSDTSKGSPLTCNFGAEEDEEFANLAAHNSENPDDDFHYSMEAPKSLKQKRDEPTMSYINKGHFYCITLKGSKKNLMMGIERVKSIISVVFGETKPDEEQLKHWKYWHSRQHTAKQRVIDIADYKESAMVREISEFSHNAISFVWDVNTVAKIYIAVNCLSTDFSAQKGIKGMPLLIQIDTFDENQPDEPIHRGACQIKVFCDKGAERKIRDEERKALRKRQKSGQYTMLQPQDVKGSIMSTGRKHDIVYYRTMHDTSINPVYFQPEISNSAVETMPFFQTRNSSLSVSEADTSSIFGALSELASFSNETLNAATRPPSSRNLYFPSNSSGITVTPTSAPSSLNQPDSETDEPTIKCPRQEPPSKILLYVRKSTEEIFDALMLRQPNVRGLTNAIAEKYAFDANKITRVYKKQKRGILVNMDDNIIQHYCHEDTFIIDFLYEDDGSVRVTLAEFTGNF